MAYSFHQGSVSIFFFFFLVVAITAVVSYDLSPYPTNQLLPGDILKTGENLTATNYHIAMQPDCNMVYYDSAGQARWATGTDNKGIYCEFRLDHYGNLGVYNSSGVVLSQVNSVGSVYGNYIFVLQTDGNAVLYSKAVWSSGSGTLMVSPA